jgi:hypothetical protein
MKHSPKKFNIEYRAKFTKIGKNNGIRVWVAQPLSFECQKIEKFSIYPTPKKNYRDKQGNKILYFHFKDKKFIEIKISIKATLWKNETEIKKEKIPQVSIKLFNQYIKNEKFLEQTAQIKRLTDKITENDELVLDKIKSIFNFISQNFKYCYPVKRRGVKNLKLNDLRGDCGEYSGLFVTMCRILRIPAKNNTGFVISPKYKKIVEHGWASIYLKLYGWIDFDAQYAAAEKNSAKKYFGQRNDYRIIFTNGFNIPLKPSTPKSLKSVQVLQPIFFISKQKTQFKDIIKLKRP